MEWIFAVALCFAPEQCMQAYSQTRYSDEAQCTTALGEFIPKFAAAFTDSWIELHQQPAPPFSVHGRCGMLGPDTRGEPMPGPDVRPSAPPGFM